MIEVDTERWLSTLPWASAAVFELRDVSGGIRCSKIKCATQFLAIVTYEASEALDVVSPQGQDLQIV